MILFDVKWTVVKDCLESVENSKFVFQEINTSTMDSIHFGFFHVWTSGATEVDLRKKKVLNFVSIFGQIFWSESYSNISRTEVIKRFVLDGSDD